MTIIKKIFIFIPLLFFFNTQIYGAIKDSIFATVGNQAITKSDIIEEIKYILILSNRSFDESEREKIETAAINQIIKRKIKLGT